MCLELVTLDDKPYVLAGYESGKIVLYDYKSGKVCAESKLREYITSLTFDAFTKRALCGNTSNQLQLFTINNLFEISLKCEISIVNEGCNVVKLRPDRKIFITGGWDNRIRVNSWKTLRILAVLSPHRKPITDIQFSPREVQQHDAKIMACSSADGGVSLWNIYN